MAGDIAADRIVERRRAPLAPDPFVAESRGNVLGSRTKPAPASWAHARRAATRKLDGHVPADVQVTVDVADDGVAESRGAAPTGNPFRQKGGGNLANGLPDCRQERWNRVR